MQGLTKFQKVLLYVGGVGGLLVVLALVLGYKGCDAADDAKSAKDRVGALDKRVGAVETKVDALGNKIGGLEGTVDALGGKVEALRKTVLDYLPKKGKKSDGGAAASGSSGTKISHRPARRPAAPAATSSGRTLSDVDADVQELKRWRKDEVDPALQGLAQMRERLEALGAKGAK